MGVFDRQILDADTVHAVHQDSRVFTDVGFVGVGVEYAFLRFVEADGRIAHAVADNSLDTAEGFVDDDGI